MLDANDLKILQSMIEGVIDKRFDEVDKRLDAMDTRFDEIDKRLDAMDTRFDEIDKRLDAMDTRFDKMDKRLDAMDTRFDEIDSRLDAVDNRFDEMDKRFDKKLVRAESSILVKIDRRLAKSENLVLEEMERTRRNLEVKIQNVQNNLDHIQEYYRITRLEQDNAVMILRIVSDLQNRVEILEQKTA